MSTPNWFDPNEGPTSEQLRARAAGEDLVAASRSAADVTNITNTMVEGVDQMIQTLTTRIDALSAAVVDLPSAFASTAEHIKRGAEATEKLAKNTERAAKANKESEKSLKNQKFSVKDMAAALAKGDIGGALGEAFQGLPGADRIKAAQARRGGYGSMTDQLAGRLRYGPVTKAGEAGAVADEAMGGARAGGLMARFGAGAAAGGLGVLASLWSPAAIFAAYKFAQQGIHDYQTATRTGALTGEGAGAGLAATGVAVPLLGHIGGEAQHLRGNIFDLVGDKEAMQIVQGVRGAGFRGGEARGLEESIRDMVNDLGVGVEDAMKIAIPAIKEAGMSTDQLSEQMKTLDDTAKSAHISIGDLTTAVGGLITANAQFSRDAAQRATGQMQALESQFQGTAIARTGGLAKFGQGTGREAIAQLNGFAPYEAYSAQFNKNFQMYFTRVLVRLAQGKPAGMDWQKYVAMMMLDPMWQQLFGDTPYPQIGDMLRRVWRDTDHGRNTEGYLRKTRTEAGRKALERTHGRAERIGDRLAKLAYDNEGHLSAKNAKTMNAQINDLDAQMITAGIGKKDRVTWEREIKQSIRSGKGTDNEVHAAMDKIAKRIEEASKNFHARTTVDIHPRANKFFKVLNTTSIEAARGQRSKQGTVDTP